MSLPDPKRVRQEAAGAPQKKEVVLHSGRFDPRRPIVNRESNLSVQTGEAHKGLVCAHDPIRTNEPRDMCDSAEPLTEEASDDPTAWCVEMWPRKDGDTCARSDDGRRVHPSRDCASSSGE
jgi:hypothetical protein